MSRNTYTGIMRIEMPYEVHMVMPEGRAITPKDVLRAMNVDASDTGDISDKMEEHYRKGNLSVEVVVLKQDGEAMPVPLKVTVGA